mgnify:CR=1 FL=1
MNVVAAPSRTESLHASDLDVLDDPIEQQRFTRWTEEADGQRHAESAFQLSGMYCAACAGIIESALSGLPGVELVLTTLHSGGKYGQGGYKFSGGTHGVGAKCVNAVSEWFEVEVSRGGQVHHMEFERGQTMKKLEVIGKAKGTGTLITFKPDAEIFRETTVFKSDRIAQRLRELLQQRDELSRERDRLLRLLAHEVRQPLHNACGALESARSVLLPQCDGCAGRIVFERMERAQAVLSTVQSVLDNTLTAANLLSRHEPLTMQDVDVDLLIALAVGDLGESMRARVSVVRLSSLHSVELDLGLMRVALRNLLRNAFVHGGLDVKVQVRIEERCSPPAFVLAVCDDGPGLPADVIERLQRQADVHDEAPFGLGTASGLGLHLVQRIMRLHQGHVEWSADNQRGTCIRLVIPLEFEE